MEFMDKIVISFGEESLIINYIYFEIYKTMNQIINKKPFSIIVEIFLPSRVCTNYIISWRSQNSEIDLQKSADKRILKNIF